MTLIQRDPEVLDNVHYAEGKEVQAEEEIRFGTGGKSYKLDLTTANAQRFRADLKPWIDVAEEVSAPRQVVGSRSSRGSRSTTRPERELTAKIREWAAGQGITLNEKGRIKTQVRELYFDAHPEERPAA